MVNTVKDILFELKPFAHLKFKDSNNLSYKEKSFLSIFTSLTLKIRKVFC